ncbi:MAG TPA: acyltransferase [Casimicrobiaceae bacterium]|nr:acyltransferase [Casimicrobiaceae bacterium]
MKSLGAPGAVGSDTEPDARLAALEGLRGYAALLVFLVHAFGLLALLLFVVDLERYSVWSDRDPIRIALILLYRSHYGVDLFFVLSGLLMADLALRRWPGTLQFLSRRWLRIYPAYAVSLFAAAMVFWPGRDLRAVDVLGNIALVQGIFVLGIPALNPPTSSLTIEAVFYLVVPIAASAWLGGRRAPGPSSLAAAFVAIVAVAALMPVRGGIQFACFALFVPGVAIGLLDPAARENLARRVPLAVVLLAWMGFTLARKLELISIFDPAYYVCSAIAAGLLVLKACDSQGILARALASPILRWLGRYSYSFFLVHFIIVSSWGGWVAQRTPASNRLLFATIFLVGSLAFSLAAARVLYAITERFYFRRR